MLKKFIGIGLCVLVIIVLVKLTQGVHENFKDEELENLSRQVNDLEKSLKGDLKNNKANKKCPGKYNPDDPGPCRSSFTRLSRLPICPKCPDLSNYVLKSEIPNCPDMRNYIHKKDIPPYPDMSQYIHKKDIPPYPDMSEYIKKSDIPPCPTRWSWSNTRTNTRTNTRPNTSKTNVSR